VIKVCFIESDTKLHWACEKRTSISHDEHIV